MSNNCSDFRSAEITYILQGVVGSIGAVVCTVALIFVLVSRFYKDIVQRLIVYKLIAMLVHSLSWPLLLIFIYCNEESIYYKIIEKIVPGLIPAAYFINLFLTFWLSVVLFFWLIFLKELKTLQKIEPLMIISSLFGVVFLIIYAIFVEFDDCTFNTNSSSIVRDTFKGLGAFYGLLHLMIVMMLIIIVITICKRSRSHLVNEEESNPLLTNDTCKMLLKQLLPIIVYPIITVIFSFIYIFVFVTNIPFPTSFKFALSFLLSAPGPVTGLVVIIYLCILKCKCRKKSGREEEKEDLSENGGITPTTYYSISTSQLPPVNN